MSPYFSAEDIQRLTDGYNDAHTKFLSLRDAFAIHKYKTDRAKEYAFQGFIRRADTLIRMIDRTFDKLPPELDGIPELDDVIDATSAIQSFVINAFGCLDNLAWIWVFEKGVTDKKGKQLDRKMVGLGSDLVRKSFTPKFREYLDHHKTWFENLKNFRDSLAHRIPLFIPPYVIPDTAADEHHRLENEIRDISIKSHANKYERLRLEQRKLGVFRPWMTHSIYEKSPSIVFHYQLLQDFITVDECARTMLAELEK